MYTIRDVEETVDAEETNGNTSVTVSRRMYVDSYGGALEAAGDLLGGYRIVGGFLIRIFPRGNPRLPFCRCSKISIKPRKQMVYGSPVALAGTAGLDRVDFGWPAEPRGTAGELQAVYSLPSVEQKTIDQQGSSGGGDQQQEIELATETWDFATKQMKIPHQYYIWQYSGRLKRNDDALVTKVMPDVNMTLVRHRCLFKPVETITKLLGKTNKQPFTLRWGPLAKDLYPPETILFAGASSSRRLTTAHGLMFYEIGFKFAVRPHYELCVKESGPTAGTDSAYDYVGWNRTFNTEKGWWERLFPEAYVGNLNRQVYAYAEDVSVGGQPNAGGLASLFNPRNP